MSDVLLGVLVSVSLIGTGVFLLNRIPAELPEAAAKRRQLRQAGVLSLLMGAAMSGLTVYLLLRGK